MKLISLNEKLILIKLPILVNIKNLDKIKLFVIVSSLQIKSIAVFSEITKEVLSIKLS